MGGGVSGKTSKRRRTGNGTSTQSKQAVRAGKRAQFEQPRSRATLHLILASLALAAVVAVAAVVLVSRDSAPSAAPAAPVAAAGDTVTIPVAEISDGQAHFYSYDAGGTEVKYFVMKSKDGEYRAAFDACDVCYPNKKGYHQEGDVMVCNNCGRRFASNKINVLEGGCNPSPIERSVKGKTLVLQTADLQAGVQYFQ
jgi:uncharacterized membrane protein